MAPLPTTNTSRLLVDYQTAVGSHTLLVRYQGNDPSQAALDTGELLTAMSPFLFVRTITGLRAAVAGDENTFPFVHPLVGDSFGSLPANFREDAQFIGFAGRSIDGRQVKLTLFGAKYFNNSPDFRLTEGEDPDLTVALNALESFEGTFLTISGLGAVWNRYANQGTNAYWQRQYR